MRYLILGCNGMAGHLISIYLQKQGHSVIGLARKKSPYVPTIVGDVTDRDFLKEIIINRNDEIIVNCIGILPVAAEENIAVTIYINSYLPHFLAELTRNRNQYIIEMSTDCVFSGKRGGYTEQDFKDGNSIYDRTKSLGEIDDNKNLTIRCSIVGPDLNKDGVGLFNWFMKQKNSIKGYRNAIWSGQTTLQYAKMIEIASKQRVTGLYNMVPEQAISKYELLKLFNKYFRNNSLYIEPIEEPRFDKSLKRTRFDFDYYVPDYENMILDLSEWMKINQKLYPHYYKLE